MARLGLVGDVMLGRLVDERQRGRAPEAVWGDVLDRLRGLDGLFVNLECVLSTGGERWTETDRSSHFRANPEWAVPALERAGVSFASLANNHAMDFGATALTDTLDHLIGAGIAHAGAGRSLLQAREPGLVSVGGYDVAVVAFTDNTPEYAAREDRAGVAYLDVDPDDAETRAVVTDALETARSLGPDLVVASLHLGPNMVSEPAATHERFGRFLAEQGVDIVHGHSAHVVQGIEHHAGTPILYDTGDFVDDYRVDRELRNDRTFLFVADVDATGVHSIRLEPVEIEDCMVTWADDDAAAGARKAIRERSRAYGTTFERDGEALVTNLR
jgi:poly-gamma-glutamate capsule biosynthesis protein CapA/YwtB (metallophosphatase superfamily)